MKVVLLERVTSLGAIGDVVTVKDGYARNFLLPRAKALRATASNLKAFEGRREEIEARNADNRQDAQRRGDRIDGQSYILIRQAGESGQLYGSVSGRDVAEAMEAEGARVQRGQIVLDRPIKTLGVHDVKVQLHRRGRGHRPRQRGPLAGRGRAPGGGRGRDRLALRRRARPGRRGRAGHAVRRRRPGHAGRLLSA